MSGGEARLSVWRGTPSGSSIQARVDALEQNLETVRSESDATAKKLQEEQRNRTEAVKAEREARVSVIDKLNTRVNKLAAGGLHIEWMGVLWLVLGVVLATVSTEIACALTWLGVR